MKKPGILLLSVLLLICSACSAMDAHPEWDKSWTRFGDVMALDAPDDLTLIELNDALSVYGIYYASFGAGNEKTKTDADDGATIAYHEDAQLFISVSEKESPELAEAECAKLMTHEQENYDTKSLENRTVNGQEYQLLLISEKAEDNIYFGGCAAFSVRENAVITVELLIGESAKKNAEEWISEILSAMHF